MVDPANPVQTIEFIEAMLAGWKLHGQVMEDGKINLYDIPAIIAVGPKLWNGFVGIDKIDDEMLVINDEGRAKIKAKIEEFVIAGDEELEELIEDLLELILQIVEIGKRFSEYFSE